jgi:hypothetical protein
MPPYLSATATQLVIPAVIAFPTHDVVRHRLIEAAQMRKLITYGELVEACNLPLDLRLDHDGAEIGRILGDISRRENEHCHPLLSAVAVLADSRLPSDGFYRLAEELKFGTAKRLRQELFREKEMTKCFNFWSVTTEHSLK